MLMDPMVSNGDSWIYRCRRGSSYQSNVSEAGQMPLPLLPTPTLRSKSFSMEKKIELGFRVVCGPMQRKTKERYNDNEG